MSARIRDWAPNCLSPGNPAILQPISHSPDHPHLPKPILGPRPPLMIAILKKLLKPERAAASECRPPHQSQRGLGRS